MIITAFFFSFENQYNITHLKTHDHIVIIQNTTNRPRFRVSNSLKIISAYGDYTIVIVNFNCWCHVSHSKPV